ncbi:MAG: Gfo/Idh/MocA family oxidoreductase [Clostridiaceae bacterium]|nr:Gfo/Idh/MocA family oxidoreductase [Clostridiaceae bacterium]
MEKNHHETPLRVAIIGCGRVAKKHMKAVLHEENGLEICALVDSDKKAALALLEETVLSDRRNSDLGKKVKLFPSTEAMLAVDPPDIAAVTLPSGLHYATALPALEAGCHIIMEKPMTLRISEARELFEFSESKSLKIAMGHIYRYFPLMQTLHNEIKEGAWGKISHGSVIVRWGHDQAYYDQAAWRGTWKLDGGALMNQSIHALDLMCYLMNTTPSSAFAHLAKRYRNMEAEDVGGVVFGMEDGSLCLLEGTTATGPNDHEASFFINAERGNIRIGLRNGIPFFDIRDIKGKNIRGKYLRRELKRIGIKGFLETRNPHIQIYRNLRDSIISGDTPIADAYSGYISVMSMLSAYRSAKEGVRINIPGDRDFSLHEMTGFFPHL